MTIFTVLYQWHPEQNMFDLFLRKVSHHCHFLRNAYRLVLNIYLKFDHYLNLESKYQKQSWLNLMGCTITNIHRFSLILSKAPWETAQINFRIFTHGTISPKQSPFSWWLLFCNYLYFNSKNYRLFVCLYNIHSFHSTS